MSMKITIFYSWQVTTETKYNKNFILSCIEKAVKNLKSKPELKNIEFTFYDYVTDGFLHSRLAPQLRNQRRWSWQQTEMAPPIDFFDGEENFLALVPLKEDQIVVITDFQGQKKQWTIEAPMKAPLMLERRKQYFAEMALIKSLQLFKS